MNDLLKNNNLSSTVVEILEEAVFSGLLKPGDRIVESKLSLCLGISKSPVREALKKLEGDGIIQLISRKGYFVRKIDVKDINDFFDIMVVIEPAIAGISLRNKNDAKVSIVKNFVVDMEKALNDNNYDAYLRLNDDFHSFFYEANDNEWIKKIIHLFRKNVKILRALSFTKDRFLSSLSEHSDIARAYTKGDQIELEAKVRYHIEVLRKNILSLEYFQPHKGKPEFQMRIEDIAREVIKRRRQE